MGTHAAVRLKRSASAGIGLALHALWARMRFSGCGFLEGFLRSVACTSSLDRPAVGWRGQGCPAENGAMGFQQLPGSVSQAYRQRAEVGVAHVCAQARAWLGSELVSLWPPWLSRWQGFELAWSSSQWQGYELAARLPLPSL